MNHMGMEMDSSVFMDSPIPVDVSGYGVGIKEGGSYSGNDSPQRSAKDGGRVPL